MRIDLWTFGLQTINALVLVWLLARFLFRPVVAIIARRRAEADGLLADAAAARDTAAADAAAIKAQRAEINDEVARLRAEALVEAAAERTAGLERARRDSEVARSEAVAALARDQTRLRSELEANAGRLAVEIAGRLLARVPAASVTAALARRLPLAIAALPPGDRRQLLEDAGALEAVTAAELDASARDAVIDGLARCLGVTPVVTFRVDAALLGGIELRGPHVLLRDSWRTDLQRIGHDLEQEPAHA
jgi:F-type H+-transporting ATPase subunit b